MKICALDLSVFALASSGMLSLVDMHSGKQSVVTAERVDTFALGRSGTGAGSSEWLWISSPDTGVTFLALGKDGVSLAETPVAKAGAVEILVASGATVWGASMEWVHAWEISTGIPLFCAQVEAGPGRVIGVVPNASGTVAWVATSLEARKYEVDLVLGIASKKSGDPSAVTTAAVMSAAALLAAGGSLPNAIATTPNARSSSNHTTHGANSTAAFPEALPERRSSPLSPGPDAQVVAQQILAGSKRASPSPSLRFSSATSSPVFNNNKGSASGSVRQSPTAGAQASTHEFVESSRLAQIEEKLRHYENKLRFKDSMDWTEKVRKNAQVNAQP